MPPRSTLSAPLRAWRCPQCTLRNFSNSARFQAVGPEHPQYLPVADPPQATIPYRPFPKGRLPVPRDVFSGAGSADKASDEWLEKHTRAPLKPRQAAKGSREEWKAKMSEMRRQNLREGIKSLRTRRTRDETRRSELSQRKQAEREELVHRPEREDERLTTPSHGLDLDALYHGRLTDPTRSARLALKRENVASQALAHRAARETSLNKLYQHARSFIVTPAQLDQAVDEAFGTNERPHNFAKGYAGDTGTMSRLDNAASVWTFGAPEKVQEMLNRANGQRPKRAMDGSDGNVITNRERIQRIAEVLTGGKMEKRERGFGG